MTSSTVTAPASLEKLQLALRGKRCVVVGAAPLEHGDLVVRLKSEDEIYVAVNGGISSCPLSPAVWIVNSRSGAWQSWGAERLRLANLMLEQARDRRVGLIVFLAREDDAPAVTSTHLRNQGTTWDDAIALVQSERHELERAAGGRGPQMEKHALSAGMTAACICLASGADHVRLEGFSWKAGYQYAPGDPAVTTRGHEHGDKVALRLLEERFGTRLEHQLTPARERSMSTVQKVVDKAVDKAVKQVLGAQSPEPKVAPRKAEPGFKVRVREGKTVWYGNQRLREGAVFTLRAASHFKPKVHERVDESTPARAPRASDVGRQRDMQLAQQITGGRARQLKANAADLVDTVGTGNVQLEPGDGDGAID